MNIINDEFDTLVVIVDFNSIDRTIQYINDAIEKLISFKALFAVVENGDENDDPLREKYSEVKDDGNRIKHKKIDCYSFFSSDKNHTILFLKAKQNYGFAVANNIGVECTQNYIVDSGIYIFSNNDIIFPERIEIDYYKKMFERDEKLGLIGPSVIGIDGKRQTPYKFIGFWKKYIKTFILWPLDKMVSSGKVVDDIIHNAENGIEPYRVIGAFMIFSKRCFEMIEMFDEKTFMYYEESIISERLKNVGLKLVYDDKYHIIHQGGATTSNVFTNTDRMKIEFDSALYYYQRYRNLNYATVSISKKLFSFYLFKRSIIKRFTKD